MTMTDKNSTDSRRKLLKSIAAGSGAVIAGKSLPESWSKPIVDTVMLPAHAATTATDDSSTERTCCAGVFCGLDFDSSPVAGSAIVNSDCTISMEGIAAGEGVFEWSGSGVVEADGTFSFIIIDKANSSALETVTGKVANDCSIITGFIASTRFFGEVTPGETSIDKCELDI